MKNYFELYVLLYTTLIKQQLLQLQHPCILYYRVSLLQMDVASLVAEAVAVLVSAVDVHSCCC